MARKRLKQHFHRISRKTLRDWKKRHSELKDLREVVEKMKNALTPFADKFRERMLEDTPVTVTNGDCRKAKELLE
jgi:hypothetical protein